MTLTAHLTHDFGDFTLDAAIEAGPGVTALFGPSGSGKTSLINMIAGLIQPDQGHIALGDTILTDTAAGRNIPVHQRRIGYVFQDGRLFPHMSVAGNIRFGKRFARADILTPEADIVDLLGIARLMNRLPGELSGGGKAARGFGPRFAECAAAFANGRTSRRVGRAAQGRSAAVP